MDRREFFGGFVAMVPVLPRLMGWTPAAVAAPMCEAKQTVTLVVDGRQVAEMILPNTASCIKRV